MGDEIWLIVILVLMAISFSAGFVVSGVFFEYELDGEQEEVEGE